MLREGVLGFFFLGGSWIAYLILRETQDTLFPVT